MTPHTYTYNLNYLRGRAWGENASGYACTFRCQPARLRQTRASFTPSRLAPAMVHTQPPLTFAPTPGYSPGPGHTAVQLSASLHAFLSLRTRVAFPFSGLLPRALLPPHPVCCCTLLTRFTTLPSHTGPHAVPHFSSSWRKRKRTRRRRRRSASVCSSSMDGNVRAARGSIA